MSKVDRTFSTHSAYGSDAWCATTMGWSLDRFKRERPALEKIGFPRVDTIVGLTNKGDVQEWINRRRQLAERPIIEASSGTTPRGINHDNL